MALRPCAVCGVPCPEGDCPRHPKARRWRNRPPRASKLVYASAQYRQARREALRGAPRCIYCRLALATTGDHVIPIAKGGAWGAGNVAASCSPCNSSKGDRTIAEWIRSGTASEYAHQMLGRGRYSDG